MGGSEKGKPNRRGQKENKYEDVCVYASHFVKLWVNSLKIQHQEEEEEDQEEEDKQDEEDQDGINICCNQSVYWKVLVGKKFPLFS